MLALLSRHGLEPHPSFPPPFHPQIFSERPEVHRAYLAHVPHSMDERSFWTRYFKQQYARMARRCWCSCRVQLLGVAMWVLESFGNLRCKQECRQQLVTHAVKDDRSPCCACFGVQAAAGVAGGWRG